ncbi:Glycosyl hydrolase superfamily protein [Hibiscus syriacus]|uniref:Glycosyl hydrolase superfamily protein n=1 Tax=Hibiscus syriacus TaxID=106335 RepID=A0A6A3CS45_HIBSY|nr:Glycosyl hydrolase superfamily protein [Hibiscus syriacus]
MVVPLGPGKFYGSSLPRPRIYTETRFNSERVDPPVPVLDPLLSWANEAHWSMGGLSFKRLRLQGRIEGNVKRLKAQREKLLNEKDDDPIVMKNNRDASMSPPPAPMAIKRKRFFDLIDDDDVESESESDEMVVKREAKRASRKGPIAEEVNAESEVVKKRRRIVKGLKNDKDKLQQGGTGTRSSPRLAKRG